MCFGRNTVVCEVGLICQDPQEHYSEIVMYTHQAVNLYYYKLTVDGVNVILVSILFCATVL